MNKERIKKLAYIPLMTALIVVCSWISLPFPIPFTMQTFGVFIALRLTGGKCGTASIALYILLGAVGLPVFSAGGSGIGYIMGPTGGYLVGFLVCGVLYTLLRGFDSGTRRDVLILALCSMSYYISGTVWYILTTHTGTSPKSILTAVAICTLPYIIPDGIKLLLSEVIYNKLKRILKYDKSV